MTCQRVAFLCCLLLVLHSASSSVLKDGVYKKWAMSENNPYDGEPCYKRCQEVCGGICLYDTMRFTLQCMCGTSNRGRFGR